MKLVLDIASSAVFWRQCYPVNRAPKAPLPIEIGECAFTARTISALLPPWVDDAFLEPTDGVLHVLSLNRSHCRRLKDAAVHSWSGSIPEGAFYAINEHVLVESPAFMFLHAATSLGFDQLVAYGDELCGLYSFDARKERGFSTRTEPLATKETLRSLLAQAVGCPGRKRALQALPYIIERSASPMETYDEATMCLPYMRGGYHQPQPSMNLAVRLTTRAARIAKRKTCFLDMGYPEEHLDVEHHGKYDHTSTVDKAADFARVNGLKEMGYEVIELTWEQVGDLYTYEYIIQRIAKILGRRIPRRVLGATEERLQLRKALGIWNASSGRIRPAC